MKVRLMENNKEKRVYVVLGFSVNIRNIEFAVVSVEPEHEFIDTYISRAKEILKEDPRYKYKEIRFVNATVLGSKVSFVGE